MEKAVAILEKYIEWIAITIGGLLFMYALWTYWIRPDVNVPMGATTVGPRTVDMAVRRGPGASLESAINSPFVRVRTDIPDLPGEFARELEMASYNPRPMQVPGFYLGANPVGRPDGSIPSDFRVTMAPVPPPAVVRKLATGRSYAVVPEGKRDLAEVRVDFHIAANAIAQAFREVRLPQVHQNTSLLRVQLMRQRLLADGTWGPEEEVPLLENNPLANMDQPAEQAAIAEKLEYASFVEQNPQWLREPPFYPVRAGDDPMALQVAVDAMAAASNPATGPATRGTQTNPNHQDDPRASKAQNPGQSPQQPPAAQPPAAEGNQPAPAANGPGVFNAVMFQGAVTGWAWDVQAQPGETYRYRVIYALKNPMFNTAGIAAANQPELQELLSLLSPAEQTEWSPPITVEPLTYFYMTGATKAQARFTVFRWQNGGWKSYDFETVPGDAIGSLGDGEIDFRTGRTLVDVREDLGSNETYALLVDSEGRFTRRSGKDTADPKFKQLQDEVKASAGVANR